MKKLINLTPHEIKIVDEKGDVKLIIPPSGKVARVKTRQEVVGRIDDIPVVKTVLEGIEGLPEPKEGHIYIVSSLVAQNVKDRDDVIAPDTSPQGVMRDEKGNIIGVKRFQKL